jgi:protoporphyrinogen oxidase
VQPGNTKPSVHIIGAGVSGLVCALELEHHGFSPIIIEQKSEVGGRLQTLNINGNVLDCGFQVLLTAYPAVKRYLDLEALDLQHFVAGAAIIKNGVCFKLGDPLRHPNLWLSTLDFPFATLKDKLLILKMVLTLRLKSIKNIFETDKIKTRDYLINYGFSSDFIQNFFTPFFAGIFLDKSLATSARMFQFVMKMFAEGSATIPAKGIQEIPIQLRSKLKNTTFLFNTTVASISDQTITLTDGRQLGSDYIVIATEPSKILANTPSLNPTKWHRCVNLYFEVEKPLFDLDLLGLIADESRLINNFHFIKKSNPENSTCIISVTIINNSGLALDKLVPDVAREIQTFCQVRKPELIHAFEIDEALPINPVLRYKPRAQDIRITDRVFLAGDHLANPSLNGAMESGKAAADLILHDISAE